MPQRRPPRAPGRPAATSGLPAPIEGEPFSLLGTLRRTRRPLTVRDTAELFRCSEKTIYKRINLGKIPVLDLGFDHVVIDPRGLYDILAQDNPHLLASERRNRAA